MVQYAAAPSGQPTTLDLLKLFLFQRFQCDHPGVGFLAGKLLCLRCGLETHPAFSERAGMSRGLSSPPRARVSEETSSAG